MVNDSFTKNPIISDATLEWMQSHPSPLWAKGYKTCMLFENLIVKVLGPTVVKLSHEYVEINISLSSPDGLDEAAVNIEDGFYPDDIEVDLEDGPSVTFITDEYSITIAVVDKEKFAPAA